MKGLFNEKLSMKIHTSRREMKLILYFSSRNVEKNTMKQKVHFLIININICVIVEIIGYKKRYWLGRKKILSITYRT